MKCPFCGSTENKVTDSRSSMDDMAVRRRRECLECERRFTTYEVVENIPLTVIKKDGKREPFNRQKLLTGISLACRKRPVSADAIEAMVDGIEHKIRAKTHSEIKAEDIGEMVMERLKHLDEVAYVRFASVYRQFKDTSEFLEELEQLLTNNQEGKE
jgi:transcriptional repressor NrdR